MRASFFLGSVTFYQIYGYTDQFWKYIERSRGLKLVKYSFSFTLHTLVVASCWLSELLLYLQR